MKAKAQNAYSWISKTFQTLHFADFVVFYTLLALFDRIFQVDFQESFDVLRNSHFFYNAVQKKSRKSL